MNRTSRRSLSIKDVVRGAIWAVGVLLLLFVIVTRFSEDLRQLTLQGLEWVQSLGPLRYVAFIILYAALSMIGTPSTPLDIGAGLIFHIGMGFVVSMAGSMLAILAGFFVARRLLHGWVARRIRSIETATAIMEAVEEESFKIVLLTRLNPVVPATLKNYLFGVTDVPVLKYLAASMLGIIVPVFIHVYFGAVGRVTLHGGFEEFNGAEIFGIVTGLIVSVALGGLLFYYGKRKLDERTSKR